VIQRTARFDNERPKRLDLFDCPVEHVNSYGTAAVGSSHYARLQPWARFPPFLWNGSWNGAPDNPAQRVLLVR
jgi:hypothetical protein